MISVLYKLMIKITSNIYQVGGSGLSHSSDAAVYLVTSENESALIDSGTGKGTKRILDNIKSTGTDLDNIRYLFLTHCHYDHTGGAAGIRGLTGSSIIAHELDAVYIENGDSEITAASWYGTRMEALKIDIKVKGNSRNFKVGDTDLMFYHTPGHSPGSSVLTTMSGGMLVLFGQDVHGPLDPSLRSSMKDYKASLAFLLSLDADILCEGHFGIIKGKDKVRKFIESYL
jgi:glyoxylase-like metal-dependent hydrolase (beta-lactamase superfamily II)